MVGENWNKALKLPIIKNLITCFLTALTMIVEKKKRRKKLTSSILEIQAFALMKILKETQVVNHTNQM